VHRRIHYDQLTGLLTLTSFYQQLDAEMSQSTTDRAVFTLAMTDLDGLKKVNDTHGHLAGAMAVQEMGAMIRSVLRPDDRGGLYGGDETILLFSKTPIEEATQLAEHIRTTIQARVFEHQGKNFGVTISQGLAEWPRHGKTAQEIVAAADGALYAAKAAGRNCVRCVGGES
jgi:diguanylate cyclase (GGDEF)-like protein